MAAALFLLFLVVPFAELAVLIAVGDRIGVPETLLLMVAMSAVGAVMAKRQGLRILRAVQQRVERGEVPGRELLDGLLVLVAAALLLTPGLLTDAFGILLLLPPVRAGVRTLVRRVLERRVRVVQQRG